MFRSYLKANLSVIRVGKLDLPKRYVNGENYAALSPVRFRRFELHTCNDVILWDL